MFVAMNRFSVRAERNADFELSWQERESYLEQVPGFVAFALLKGDSEGEYISHSTWESRGHFKAWTESDVFQRAHRKGLNSGVLADRPRVSLYETVPGTERGAGARKGELPPA
jgi:heme-degrading monooxygenase HmoA